LIHNSYLYYVIKLFPQSSCLWDGTIHITFHYLHLLVVLKFEYKASCLLCRYSTAWGTLPALCFPVGLHINIYFTIDSLWCHRNLFLILNIVWIHYKFWVIVVITNIKLKIFLTLVFSTVAPQSLLAIITCLMA
jgi:hypothetical protein